MPYYLVMSASYAALRRVAWTLICRVYQKNSKKKEMRKMKELFRKFETAMMATAFAEEGEFDTARQIMNEDKPRKTGRPDINKRVSDRPILRAE